MDDDVKVQQGASSAEREVAQQWLGALVKLIAELELAFHGHDPQEAKRPIAARQLRYLHAMRAIGDMLKSVGYADLQYPFYELAEAFHDHTEGRYHPLLGMDDTVKLSRGAGFDRHELWRLRARLCAGILWLMEASKKRGVKDYEKDAIREAMRGHKPQLLKLARFGTESLEGAIGGWLKRFGAPTSKDNAFAVTLFRAEKKDVEAEREVMSSAELTTRGLNIIKWVAWRASRLLTHSRSKK
jgi:hypothetical protein